MSYENKIQNANEKTNKKTLSPKIDVVFQALFGEVGSERITKKFLETILKQQIDEIDLSKNPIIRRDYVQDKLGILDVIAKINNSDNCNIEIQLASSSNIIDRLLYYWSKLYVRDIKSGENYKTLSKTISVLIADFEIPHLKDLPYHSEWQIIEKNFLTIILTNKLNIHIIEIPKIEKCKEDADELIDWLYFLVNPKSERVENKMKENKELKEAVEKLDKISNDEQMRRIAELREKAILDENSRISDISESFNQGMEKRT